MLQLPIPPKRQAFTSSKQNFQNDARLPFLELADVEEDYLGIGPLHPAPLHKQLLRPVHRSLDVEVASPPLPEANVQEAVKHLESDGFVTDEGASSAGAYVVHL